MALPSPPFVDVDGVRNLRDIGGYPTCTGGHVRRKVVYRSADFSTCTTHGFEQLDALGIKAIFDLRSEKEVEKARKGTASATHDNNPFEYWTSSSSGPQYNFVPVFDGTDYSPEALAERFKDYASEGTEGFERASRLMLQNAGKPLNAIFAHLASPNPVPIIVHCTAGKDRTGVIVMVLLLLAGCSAETIAKEYTLTQMGLGDAWRAEAAGRLSLYPAFQGKDRSSIERMTSAREDVMLAVVRNLKQEHGDVEKYLDAIGVDDIEVRRVKAILQG